MEPARVRPEFDEKFCYDVACTRSAACEGQFVTRAEREAAQKQGARHLTRVELASLVRAEGRKDLIALQGSTTVTKTLSNLYSTHPAVDVPFSNTVGRILSVQTFRNLFHMVGLLLSDQGCPANYYEATNVINALLFGISFL